MDVIEYKLATNNPILISHAIWKLVNAIKQKVENGEDESKIPDLKFLLAQCKSDNRIVSMTACQAVVDLVRSGTLAGPRIVTSLTACLVAAKHCGAIASAVCNLLSLELIIAKSRADGYICPFNLRAPQHPLITVLELKKDAWRDVLNHARTMMKHGQVGSKEHLVLLLRPLFLYILCNPVEGVSEICRQNAWNLLIKTDGTADLQIEVLQWLRTKSLDSCIDSNSRLIQLAEFADRHECQELRLWLAPLILSMALELLRHGGDPTSNLDTLSAILDPKDPNPGSILICLLAEMISICPTIYLVDVVSMVLTVLERTVWHRTVAHMLIASIVQWMAYPSKLSSDAMTIGKKLIHVITNSPEITDNSETHRFDVEQPFQRLWQSDANVNFYEKLCSSAELWTRENILPWLDKVSKLPSYVMTNYKLIISGLFIQSKDTEMVVKTCGMLVEISKNGGQVLAMILYKLTITQDIEQARALLFSLPKLTGLKENIPIVMQTLKTLSTAMKPLNYLAIELYINALAGQPRSHRYIQTALIDLCSSGRSWQADVTCARAMRYICEKHPEHGTELVPLLSQMLNRCNDRTGGAASALVINGISALCIAGVTEICSTWRVISPKMNRENRPIVLKALCQFFGDIPLNPSQEGQQFDNLVIEILSKLWNYAINSKDIEIIEAAFKGLTGYRLETMLLCVLPPILKSSDKITETSERNENSSNNKLEDNSAHIPATCWIAILNNVNPSGLSGARNFFQHFITEELYSFRSGIYRWPHGEPVNFKYLSDKSVTRALGEEIRHYEPSERGENDIIVIECLRIFSQKYPKPLPPIKWQYIEKAVGVSSETRKYGILLACHQAPISPSAKQYLEKHLTKFTKEWIASSQQMNECLEMYAKLSDICRAVGSNVLGPYLESTLNSILEKPARDRENAVYMFDKVMACFSQALNDELIHNDNRSLLTSTLEKLIDRIDVDSEIFESYTDAAVELNSEQVERMTLPSVWLDGTPEKLKKAIRIRAKLVLTKTAEVPLTWMNEIIRASASAAAVHTYFLEQLQRILPLIRLEKSNARWTLDLMHWIGVMVVDGNETGNIECALFLCEILFMAVICLSTTDCLLLNDLMLATSHVVRAELFPQSLATIVQTAYWRDIVPQTMEWLNHMETTPIPRSYKIVFNKALVTLKNEGYFDLMWTKFLSTRATINLL